MAVQGDYLGMTLAVDDLDVENLEYFAYAAKHDFHLQRCKQCNYLTYPPRTACPWCTAADFTWVPVEGKGTVHSYGEVHQPIQPGFRPYAPYMLLLVELDTQCGAPGEYDALRVMGNLCTPDGEFAAPALVKQVGIGTRVRMVFRDVAEGLSLPQWTIDEEAEQPTPWRYPQED